MGEVLVPGDHRQAPSHELALALPSALLIAAVKLGGVLACPRRFPGVKVVGSLVERPVCSLLLWGRGGMLCFCFPDRILVESLGWSSRPSDYSSSSLFLASADFLEHFYLCNWLDGLLAVSQSALLKTNKKQYCSST